MGISQKCLYSCQHTNVEFVSDPHNELELRLEELISNEQFRQRFEAIVAPMVYNREPHDFGTFFCLVRRNFSAYSYPIRLKGWRLH